MKLIAYSFFAAAGMAWTALPGFGGVRLFQVIVVALIAISWLRHQTRTIMLALVLEHVYLMSFFMTWAACLLITTSLSPSYWLPIDVLQFAAYFLFSISLAAVISELNQKNSPLNYTLCGFLVIGGFLYVLFIDLGATFTQLRSVIGRAVELGDPDLIIFPLFGKLGELRLSNDQGIGGLRHSLSIILTVVFFMVLYESLNKRIGVFGILIVAFVLFLLFVMQSRSAWLVLAYGLFAQISWIISRNKFRLRHMLLLFPILTIGIYVAYLAFSILSARIMDTASYEVRFDRIAQSFASIIENGLFPTAAMKMVSSPHNFILDSGLSGGFVGMITAFLFVISVLSLFCKIVLLPGGILVSAALFAFVVRFFTTGSGMPGIGGFIGLAFALAYCESYQRNKRNSSA